MGQASLRKKILRPLEQIGLDKIDNIESALKQTFGEERAKQVLTEWDRLSKQADETDTPGRQDALFQYLNSEYELSLLVSRYTDAAIIREIGLWLYDHKNDFGKEILDVGCGTGILSCFLASLLPDSHITAIDRSENCIRIAEQMKARMLVSNIDFRCASAEDWLNQMDSEAKSDTVLSIRTFHENIGIRYTDYKFLDFTKQINTYEVLYQEYCRLLSGLIKEGGRLICIERNHPDAEFYSILRLLHRSGLEILPEGWTELQAKESDFQELSVFQTLISEKTGSAKGQTGSDATLFSLWRSRAFSPSSDPEYYTRSQADWFMEQQAGDLIEGYATFDESGTQLAKACLLKMKKDPQQFLMYQANYGKAGIQVLPMEALEEAKEIFAEHKTIDTARGFLVQELPLL